MINISETQIQSWIQAGVKSSIDSALRDHYGPGKELKNMMDRAIKESEPEVLAAMKVGIAKAVVSPAFLQGIEQEIGRALASQYKGAFEGVIRHAAKMAASNEIVARRVAELTRQAALGDSNNLN